MKNRLFAPGPTMVSEDTLAAVGRAPMHHRSEEFKQLYREVIENLSYVYQTAGHPLLLNASGSGAMESCVANLFRRGDRVAVVVAGWFGRRWRDIAKAYGLEVLCYEIPDTEGTDPDAFAKWFASQGKVRGLLLTHCETSTGAFHDVRAVAERIRDKDVLLVVDAVTSLGVHEVKTDAWGLDAVVCGSQKALMCPPGVSMVSLSEKAWRAVEESDLPKYYFDYVANRESAEKKSQPRFTVATSIVAGLAVSLRRIREEGIEAIIARHERLGAATRAGVCALGLRLFSSSPCNAVTAVLPPDKIEVEKIRGVLLGEHGIRVAGGQGNLQGKIFRIGHLGYYDRFDVLTVLGALEAALSSLGFAAASGAAVSAAQEAWGH
ncbi:MAG: alanine--glyoxylate aminotransferase family protein [Candidatus Eisenbacteria bacterium]|nr:alanine--glyoxylate aminotransferase family protein [Candidatus Eisenbacteria bacterium]